MGLKFQCELESPRRFHKRLLGTVSGVHNSVNASASGEEPHFKDHQSRTLILRMLSWDGNFDITGNLLEMQNSQAPPTTQKTSEF